jgi:hypothetical protein
MACAGRCSVAVSLPNTHGYKRRVQRQLDAHVRKEKYPHPQRFPTLRRLRFRQPGEGWCIWDLYKADQLAKWGEM